jgi:tRNA modification GTPase
MKQAKLIIYMADAEQTVEEIEEQVRGLKHQDIPFVLLINKSD